MTPENEMQKNLEQARRDIDQLNFTSATSTYMDTMVSCKTMEQYARQQAIEFAEWVVRFCVFLSISKKYYMKSDSHLLNIETPVYTTAELYDIFEKQNPTT